MKRKSGLDLFRVISMLMVYTTHYFWYGISGGVYQPQGIDKIIVYFLFCASLIAVDGFILSSGYFSSKKKSSSFTVSKPIFLVLELIIIRVISYILKALITDDTLNMRGLLRALIPSNYFTILFCTLYVLMPYINVLVAQLDNHAFFKMIVVSIGLFSLYTTIIDQYPIFADGKTMPELSTIGRWGSGYGYTIVQFILMYLIGAFIRRIDDSKNDGQFNVAIINILESKKIILPILYIIDVIILELWSFVSLSKGLSTITTSMEYCNPLIILNTVIAFYQCKKMNLGKSIGKIISVTASVSYIFFLLHVEILTMAQDYIWKNTDIYHVITLWIVLCVPILVLSLIFGKILYLLESIIPKKQS